MAIGVVLIGVSALLALTACAERTNDYTAAVSLRPAGDYWRVTFQTDMPATQLAFARTVDRSRQRRWSFADEDYVLVHERGSDLVRRRDGAPFSSVRIDVPASYTPLPKEYAAFSPFANGGVLAYTGRYHVCPEECGAEGMPSSPARWKFTLEVPESTSTIVLGSVRQGPATWIDAAPGTKVYVGPDSPRQTEDFIAVVDEALPPRIANLLGGLLPGLMAFYAERLEPPARKPMLFASYDPDYGRGYGRQGGTLPGQVFMHFYGPGWAGEDGAAGATTSAAGIALFFAHEAAHLFQTRPGVRPDDAVAWLHEGGADAFALIALRAMAVVPAEFAAQTLSIAFDDCVAGLGQRPLNAAASAGAYRDHYACGLLMNMAADAAVRRASGGKHDLFDIWRAFLATAESTSRWHQDDFLGVLRSHAGEDTAAFLESLTAESHADPAEHLKTGLQRAGLAPA
ncbi:MAG: hypothetical protein AAFX58_15330, partial [Pseudomonadota bacterium]